MNVESDAAPLIHLRGIRREFASEPPVAALAGIDLDVGHGEYLAITGPSGSGKSTLLNVLGCLDRPTSGEHRFAGFDMARMGDEQRAWLRARRIGFVFQAFHLLPHRSVLENVMLAELYAGLPRRGRRERALAVLERVGLGARAGFRPTRLSGGERQRAAIARAIVTQPPLVLCDEPTGNLDSVNSANILDLLDELWRAGQTVVVITHDPVVSARASRVVRVQDGRVVAGAGRAG